MHTHVAEERQSTAVQRWRRDQLAASGFTPGAAAWLASDTRFDLHALIELVDRGCPPYLAVRIVAPLEGNVDR